MHKKAGGAQLEISFLFADVRGSTALAERTPVREFSRLMAKFYGTAAKVIDARDGIVDKFVGDEVVALFIPGFAGSEHAAEAIAAARELLRETRNDASDPWIPVGASVHTGLAYVGVAGEGTVTTSRRSAIRRTQQLGSRPRPGRARSSSARQRR